MELLLVLAAALWFFYESIKALMPLLAATTRQTEFVLFLYCLIAGLILLYEGGYLALPIRH